MMYWWSVLKGVKIMSMPRFSHEVCENHPRKLFLFGDNDRRKGTGPRSGQAEIRYAENSHGIRTKGQPSTRVGAYWTDDTYEDNIAKFEEDIQTAYKRAMNEGYTHLVLPSAGWGTGHARFKPDRFAWHPHPDTQTQTFDYINSRFNELQGVDDG